jgi:hypothetical protein
VFKLFFASKASFMVFKETILPENGEQISRVKLWLIFDFFIQNKLRHQKGRIISKKPMGKTKEQREFIKAINPFFKKKYELDIRIDNTTPAANKEYQIAIRLNDEYEEMKEKIRNERENKKK